MSDLFHSQKAFNEYLPKHTKFMIDKTDFSYYYADSANVQGPEQANGDKINNIQFRSDQLQNYRFGIDETFIFNDLWDVNDYNNKITFINGITITPITLTNGRYKMKAVETDPKSFGYMLNQKLTAAGLPYSVTVADGVLTVIAGAGFRVIYPNATMEAYATKLHGIRAGIYAGNASFTPYFSYTDIIYIRSDINKYSKFDESGADGKSNIIASINLERDLYSADTNKQTDQIMNIKFFKVNEQMSPANFNVGLYDDKDNKLFIQPNSNFRYILRFLIKNYPN